MFRDALCECEASLSALSHGRFLPDLRWGERDELNRRESLAQAWLTVFLNQLVSRFPCSGRGDMGGKRVVLQTRGEERQALGLFQSRRHQNRK